MREVTAVWSVSPCIHAVVVEECKGGENCVSVEEERPSRDRGTDGEFSGRGHTDTALVGRFAVMLLVVAFFLYRSERFGTLNNFGSILIAAAPFALIALGQTLVILTGGIDLSVGSLIAASSMAAALTAKQNPTTSSCPS